MTLTCPKHPHARVITGPTIPTGRIRTYCDECHRLVPSTDALSRNEPPS